MTEQGSCPFHAKKPEGTKNSDWWPGRLNLKILAKNPAVADPMDADFDYKKAFEALDLDAVKADIAHVLTDSQNWWPADFGNYGPMFIRMAWHSAGTYRIQDGRGGGGTGQQRFAPLNSWPDNVLLDRARRLLWPIKQKYGAALSWGDLIILAGNVAHDQMGMPTIGFGGGRPEVWEPDDDVYWGSENEWLRANARFDKDTLKDGVPDVETLDNPLAATEMGLIYVNPEGPARNPDPKLSALDIRETFGRMGMNDEETVALIAGGHTFGKTHGAGDPELVGPAPEAAPMENQGLGWKSAYKSGKGVDTIGGGPEVTWTYHPTRWDNEFFHILFAYEWELMQSPAGAYQWRPKDNAGSDMVPEADLKGKREPRMLTSDLALREDPIYREISLKFAQDQEAFTQAYARAWFKLTHRDMGPKSRYLGKDVPTEDFIWQDPLPATTGKTDAGAIQAVEDAVRNSGLSVSELVSTAFAAMSSYRDSDKRGGANGGRIRLEPQRNWEVNNPAQLNTVIPVLEKIADETGVSFADTVIIAGNTGVKMAAEAAGTPVTIEFLPGRVDADQEHTDTENFKWMEPAADGFRNYATDKDPRPAEYLLVDRANLLGLSAPEMTVLVGGMRVLGTNWDGSADGVFTDRPGQLTNDFFTNLLTMDIEWKPVDEKSTRFAATDRATGAPRWTGTRADLVFGSNSELRAVAEVYASADAKEKFVRDFAQVWAKLAANDRFDLA
ncbi:MAG: catalase/peroxidase HPI [Corynebacterium sp.]|nr:catalase/peroxidase HPI [Corynebacterium sp.]